MNSNHASGEMKQKFKKPGYDEPRLETAIELFDNFLDSIREPLLVLDSELKVLATDSGTFQSLENCLKISFLIIPYSTTLKWNIILRASAER
jgi:hypothetical protein